MKANSILLLYLIFLSALAFGQNRKNESNNFTPVTHGAIACVDINQDGKKDILHMGYNGMFNNNGYNLISEVHLNQGNGIYKKNDNYPFPKLQYGTITETDLNDDGFSELLITGYTNDHKSITKLYYSDGKGNWAESIYSFVGIHNSSVGIIDIDRDGLLDIIISGSHQSEIKTLIYRNLDGKNFKQQNHLVSSFSTGSIILDDLNNDDYDDLIINGYSNKEKPITEVYLNEKGTFVLQKHDLIGSYWGGACLINTIESKLLIYCGYNSFDKQIAKMYSFDKAYNKFEVINSVSLYDNRHGAIVKADINNDGNEDFFQFGQNSKKVKNANLFISNNKGSVEKQTGHSFDGITSGFALFMDFNNDGKLDIVYSGHNGEHISFYVYKNLGGSTFKQVLYNQKN